MRERLRACRVRTLAALLMIGASLASAAAAEVGRVADGVPLLIRFRSAVRGLAPGAPVEVQGIRIGDVVSVGVEYDADDNSFVAPVVIEVQPSLFPASGPHPRGTEETYAAINALVRRGLRAQLGETQLFGGETIVTLAMRPDAQAARLGRAGPVPELPAGPTRADMIAEKLQPLLEKLADAPIDQLFAAVATAMTALRELATSPELRGALVDLHGATVDLRAVVNQLGTKSDALVARLDTTVQSTNRLIDRTGQTLATVDHQIGDRSPLLADLRGLLQQLDGAARSMRLLAEYLERNPGALITGKTDNRR